MPNLTDNWTLDRAPGQGKAIDSTGAGGAPNVTIPGPIVVGTTSPPAVYPPLPEPGVPVPPVGSPDRWKWYLAFTEAVGFDGKTCLVLPTGADCLSYSLSVWVDAGVTSVAGWTPDGYVGSLVSTVFSAGGSEGVLIVPGYTTSSGDGFPSGTNMGPTDLQEFDAGQFLSVGDFPFAYPSDSDTNAGWVHVMISLKLTPGNSSSVTSTTTRKIVYINDSLQGDTTWSTEDGGTGMEILAFSTKNYLGQNNVGLDTDPGAAPAGDGLKVALCEFWLMRDKFVDWNDPANRAKFHTMSSDLGALGSTWVPVDLGPRGTRPGFGLPLSYNTGGSSMFPINRASGSKLTVLAGGSGLFDVDDPPGTGVK